MFAGHGQGPGFRAQHHIKPAAVVTLAAHSAVDGHGLVPRLSWWGNAAANADIKAEYHATALSA